MIKLQLSESAQWHKIIQEIPGAQAHIFQSWQWGQFKGEFGWQAERFTWQNSPGEIIAAAQILTRQVNLLGMKFKVAYCPKGPILDWQDETAVRQVLDDLQSYARQENAIFIKIDPDVPLGWGIPDDAQAVETGSGRTLRTNLMERKWQFSQDQIQFRNTVLIDLRKSDDELLAAMKQKTRYNIRLAERKGVNIRVGNENDLELLYRMYASTSMRDNFVIRSEAYYTRLWATFIAAGMAAPLIAEVNDEAIAAVFVFHFDGYAIYLHGMSIEAHREKMPNYLLQWQAMLHAQSLGCHTYDMWGAPDEFNENDSLWGVYRFKDGFAGNVLRTLGAWDFPAQPKLYRFYTNILPRILNVMRRRGKNETRNGLSI